MEQSSCSTDIFFIVSSKIDVVRWQLLLIHKTAQCIIHHNYIPQLIQRINVTSASSCVFNQTVWRQRCQLFISKQKTIVTVLFLQIYSVSLGVANRLLFCIFDWGKISCIILEVINPSHR